jgi:signal transduction histidine kinase
MMKADARESGVGLRLSHGGKERVIVLSEARLNQIRRFGRSAWREPFSSQSRHELGFFMVSSMLTGVGFVFIAVTMGAGIALTVTFIGLVVVAASLRGARGLSRFHRTLARGFIDEIIEEPLPFSARPGFFGWLQSALRDRVGWRAVAYCVIKVPLSVFGVWFAFSVWVDAFFCLTYPLWGAGAASPKEFGVVLNLFPPGFLSVQSSGFIHGLFIFFTGGLLLLLAPWPMRAVVFADRRLMHALLGPDPVAARVHSLEDARAQTVDASAATLRRIERDLHDGTQAQLVALAMQLGQAKEKLAEAGDLDIDEVRRLINDAHGGAKEAIVELRDLARGIHPPVLDTGLEGALSTLAARSTVPVELTVVLEERPTHAIEAIAYFCVAELLANVAQHANASRASVRCTQHGKWLRVVVRDDGRGGAQPALIGSASSGLRGLIDRVHAVDGTLEVNSPAGGPTIMTIDLPLHA